MRMLTWQICCKDFKIEILTILNLSSSYNNSTLYDEANMVYNYVNTQIKHFIITNIWYQS